MSVAIEVNPELMITDKSSDSAASYRLDSGSEDLNRVVTSEKLDTLNFTDIPVDGFDTYLYFEDLNAVSDFVKEIRKSNDPIDVTPYTTVRHEETAIVVVHGQVSLVLSTDKSQPVVLCRPVYRVYPNKKSRELLPVQDVRKYITDTWIEECKKALFNSAGDSSSQFGAAKSSNKSENQQINTLKLGVIFVGVVIFVVAMIVIFKSGNALNDATAQQQAINSVQDGLGNSLMNANLPAQQIQQIQANNAHPANAVYGSGLTGAEGQASVEDFARLQVEQTQNMLKEMGVDVQANKQNLGCFAEDRG